MKKNKNAAELAINLYRNLTTANPKTKRCGRKNGFFGTYENIDALTGVGGWQKQKT